VSRALFGDEILPISFNTSWVKAAALVAVVLAVALPHGKGPPASACAHFDIKGTLQSISPASFGLKPAKQGASVLKIGITPDTAVFWTSHGTLAGPTVGERAWAKGKRCGDVYTATWALFRPQK
jgi:hypothetical protein